MKRLTLLFVIALMLFAATAQAVTIDTVPVGNVGNAGELSGRVVPGGIGPDRICGAVNYAYNIGKFEVTAGQYTDVPQRRGQDRHLRALQHEHEPGGVELGLQHPAERFGGQPTPTAWPPTGPTAR